MDEPFGEDCCCLWGRGSPCGQCCPELTARLAASCHRLLAQRTPPVAPEPLRLPVHSSLWPGPCLHFGGSKVWGSPGPERRRDQDPIGGRRGSQFLAAVTTERAMPPKATAVSPRPYFTGWTRHPCGIPGGQPDGVTWRFQVQGLRSSPEGGALTPPGHTPPHPLGLGLCNLLNRRGGSPFLPCGLPSVQDPNPSHT